MHLFIPDPFLFLAGFLYVGKLKASGRDTRPPSRSLQKNHAVEYDPNSHRSRLLPFPSPSLKNALSSRVEQPVELLISHSGLLDLRTKRVKDFRHAAPWPLSVSQAFFQEII